VQATIARGDLEAPGFGHSVIDFDRAERLICEGGDEVLNPPVVADGRLDEIIAELRSMLWCPECAAGRFKSCEDRRVTEKVNASGQRHRTMLRSVCPMLGWTELLDARRREEARRG
jgi:hypothetical protein